MSPRHRRFEGNRVLLCSSRCGTVPARSRHGPGTAYRTANRIQHVGPTRRPRAFASPSSHPGNACGGSRNKVSRVERSTVAASEQTSGRSSQRTASVTWARKHSAWPGAALAPATAASAGRDNAQKTTHTISVGATAPDSNRRARECASRRPLRTWPDSGNWYSRKPSLSVEHQGITFFSTNRVLVGLHFRTR
jgi:hypothetical protein